MAKKEQRAEVNVNWWAVWFGLAGIILGGFLAAKFIPMLYR